MRFTTVTMLAIAYCCHVVRAAEAPLRHGAVFFCPEDDADAVKQLERIKGDGFHLIKFASWIWTLPTPGSAFERRVRTVPAQETASGPRSVRITRKLQSNQTWK